MKQVLLLAVAFLSLVRLGTAGPCMGESLSDYIALGAGGCIIGGNTLSNFKVLSGISGGTAIGAGSVTITPNGGTGFTISTSQTASGGTPLEAIFTYDISGPLYIGISATLSGSSETVDGDVTGIGNYCEGGSFGPDGVDGCPLANGSLVTLDGVQNSDMGSFSPVSFLNVTDDLTFDPGLAGTASGGSLTNSFSFTTAVPEPVSAALAAFGLALAGAFRARSKRTVQPITKEKEQ